MNIIIVTNGFQESYSVDLVNSLANASEDSRIQLISSSVYNRDNISKRVKFNNLNKGIENKSIVKKIIKNAYYYFKLLRQISKSNPEIIHIQWLNIYIVDGILLPLYFRLIGIKVFYTAHDVLPHSRGNALYRIIFYLIYRIPHHVLVHTEFIKNRLINEFRLKSEKLTVIKHGIYNVYNDTAINKENARKIFKINVEEFVILFFGIITKYKGLDLLLEAFSKFSQEIGTSKLLIAGKVDPIYQVEFNNLIQRFKNESIIVNPGFVEDKKVHLFFKAADLIALPYLEASQSGVMFMSYTFGKPVIAPDHGGFSTDVINGKTGFLFDRGNSTSLVNAIKEVYNGVKDSSKYSAKFIKSYAFDNYSWQSTAIELTHLYKKILNNSK